MFQALATAMNRLLDNCLHDQCCKGCAEKIFGLQQAQTVMGSTNLRLIALQVETKQEAREGLQKVETFLEQQVGPNHQKLKSTVEVLSAKVDELE